MPRHADEKPAEDDVVVFYCRLLGQLEDFLYAIFLHMPCRTHKLSVCVECADQKKYGHDIACDFCCLHCFSLRG